MSFLKRVFGAKKKDKVPNTYQSIQDIQKTEDLLHKKQEVLQEKIQHEHETARKNASTNKRIAMQALKRKKRLEQQLDQLMSTMIALENQRVTLENANVNAEILDTMKDASKAIKKANKHMNIDNVNATIDEISEVTDQANEITEAIANLVPNNDDDELERELQGLMEESLNEKMLEIPKTIPEVPIILPNIPDEDPKSVKNKTDEDDVNKLMQWAN